MTSSSAAGTGDGWKTEDLQPRVVGDVRHYAYTTDQPLRYVAVANDNGVLGYLWAADADDAAGFEPRPAAGPDAFNASVWWYQKLRSRKVLGLAPAAAIAELVNEQGGPRTGRIIPGSGGEADSLAALKKLAGRRRPSSSSRTRRP